MVLQKVSQHFPGGVTMRPQATHVSERHANPALPRRTPPVDPVVEPAPKPRIGPHVSARSMESIASLRPAG
jgi:hypothetical protein